MRRDVSLIILYDSEGRVLLQQKTDDAPNFPGLWLFFGGGVEEGESFEEALRREALEELNYDFRSPKLILENEYVGEGICGKRCYFSEECNDKASLVLGEGQDMRWVNYEEAKKLDMEKSSLVVLKEIFEILNFK